MFDFVAKAMLSTYGCVNAELSLFEVFQIASCWKGRSAVVLFCMEGFP